MLNIVIPAAGRGQRFKDAGYTIPKPYLPIGGKTMLERVIENVTPSQPHRFIVIRPEDVAEVTEGAVCTVLLHKKDINDSQPLLIVNSDQLINWSVDDFLGRANAYDGYILTLPTKDPRYSFAEVAKDEIIRTAEKKPISSHGTVGVYWFKRGDDFVKAAERMIEDNDRSNNEFHVCPAYNYLPRTRRIGYHEVSAVNAHFLGTPETYERYLDDHAKTNLGYSQIVAG